MKKKLIALFVSSACILSIMAGCKSNTEHSEANSQNNVPSRSSDISSGIASADSLDSSDDNTFNSLDLTQAVEIALSDAEIKVNGAVAATDPSATVHVANDIIYYKEGQDFTYGEGTSDDSHTQAEADAHTVVHITEPGNYRITGTLSAGQIAIDLGKDAKDDSNAVVNLILENADITCSVAPAVIFYNVYECSSDNTENATKDVDTTSAGANVYIADGSTNHIHGSYVAKIYQSVELSTDGTTIADSKTAHKYDGAFYSKMTMNIYGGTQDTGILNIIGENEGLCSDLHLTIHGGTINIEAGNDGINASEDFVSVATINGGNLTVLANGKTGEGDGIDSNGWLVINGGSVIAASCETSGDAGIDSDMGIHINGGTVAATGNMLDRISESAQSCVIFRFSQKQNGETTYTLKNEESVFGEWTPKNDFTYFIISSPELVDGTYTLWAGEVQLVEAVSGNGGMGGMMRPGEGMMPDGLEIQEGMQRPEGMQQPESMQRSEGMQQPDHDQIYN